MDRLTLAPTVETNSCPIYCCLVCRLLSFGIWGLLRVLQRVQLLLKVSLNLVLCFFLLLQVRHELNELLAFLFWTSGLMDRLFGLTFADGKVRGQSVCLELSMAFFTFFQSYLLILV